MENKRTKEDHIAAWKISGLNRKEYALAEGLKYGTFKEWVYERNKNPKEVEWKPISIQEDKEEPKSFFELRILENWKLEIDLRIRL